MRHAATQALIQITLHRSTRCTRIRCSSTCSCSQFTGHVGSKVCLGQERHSSSMLFGCRRVVERSSSRSAVQIGRAGRLPVKCKAHVCLQKSTVTLAGAYTTARTVKHNSVFELSAHINRLASSCQQMLENDAKVFADLTHTGNVCSFFFMFVNHLFMDHVQVKLNKHKLHTMTLFCTYCLCIW